MIRIRSNTEIKYGPMKRQLFFLSFLFLFASWTLAEPIHFSASAPPTVIMNQPFQLVYSLNAAGRDLRVPEINGFDVLAGPFQSQSSSIQIVNGKTTSSVSFSYTYTLQAQKTGTFTIPSASIVVNGQKYTSNGLSIKVLPADASSRNENNQQGSSTNVSGDKVFIKTSVSKTNVYEQEAVLVTYKLYTLMDVIQCVNKKMPDFSGFLQQNLDQQPNKQFSYENFNGHNYGTVVLYQVLLFPQHSGIISIDKAVFDAVVRVQNRSTVHSIFDDFFDSYTNVTKTLVAPAVRINVEKLPAGSPPSFSNAVGRFGMTSSITSQNVKANDAVTIKVNISGEGNMKLVKNPELKFPSDFELYDPKISNNFKISSNGISGTKSIEYLFIPRHEGDFVIPSAEFSYFDVKDRTYKTLRTPEYKIHVAKGSASDNSSVVNNFVDKEDVRQIGKDIRYIQSGNFSLKKDEEPVFGTSLFWIMFLAPLLAAILLFAFFRKKVKDNSDISLVKNRKANKIATRRLKLAQKLLNEGNKEKFYEEVLKAVWTYLSDKLSIPVSTLTKEHVQFELKNKNIKDELTEKILEILNTCEYARYAPNTGQQEMGNLYQDAINAISEMEENFRKR